MKKFWQFLVNNIINIMMIILLLFYIWTCTYYTFENPSYKVIAGIPIMIMFYYLLYKVLNKVSNKNEKLVKWVIFLVSVVVLVLWNKFAKVEPYSDYEVLYNTAKEINNGAKISTYTFDKGGYYYFWNFQIGYALFLSAVMKVVGSSLAVLKFLEILYLSFTNMLVYSVFKKITNKNIALLGSIIYTTLLCMMLGSGIINNQHSGFLLALLAIYFVTKNDKPINKILCGLFIGLSYILRQTVLVVLLSVIVYYIYLLCKDGKKALKVSLISILLVFTSFFAITRVYDFIMVKTKAVPVSAIKSNDKYFKYILGIQWQLPDGVGSYDAITKYDYDYDKYNESNLAYLKEQYKYNIKIRIIPFVYEKMIRFSGHPDSQVDFAKSNAVTSTLTNELKYFGYVQYVLMIVCSFISCLLLIDKKRESKLFDDKYNLFKITFVLMFCAYLLIEVQSRYRYEQYITLALLAAPFLLIVFKYIDKLIDSIKKESSLL